MKHESICIHSIIAFHSLCFQKVQIERNTDHFSGECEKQIGFSYFL
nr:MAG TPA: hypothetical protein [Bacteriophage sp.]